MYLPARALLTALAVGLATLPAAADDIAAVSKVDTVTVYRSGAMVTRTLTHAIPSGTHTLVVNDLPPGAVPSSIRVEGSADGTLRIGAVDTRRVSIPSEDQAAQDAQRKALEDELERLGDAIETLRGEIETKETQKTLISNLASLPQRPPPAAGANAAGEDWSRILDLIGTGMAGIQAEILKSRIAMRDLDRQVEDIKKKLAELSPKQQSRTEVRIALEADAGLNADLKLIYQVSGASWAPLYEARLTSATDDAAAALSLSRRAVIRQHTGEAWRDVAVTLSTSRPSARPTAPVLRPMVVDFYEPPKPVVGTLSMRSKRQLADKAMTGRGESQPAAEAARPVAAAPRAAGQVTAVLERSAFEATYAVPGRVTVENTGEAKNVKLTEEKIAPKLTVRTVPRLEPSAYLYADLTLPKDAPYLAGAVSLFRDNSFVGTGRLPDLAPGAKHELGFGRDSAVTVKYDVLDEKRGETGIISSSSTDERKYRITITNQHTSPVDVLLIDQLPVALNEDITVELNSTDSPNERNFDGKRGLLAWRFNLKPDAPRKISFGYRVSWPADKKVSYRYRRK